MNLTLPDPPSSQPDGQCGANRPTCPQVIWEEIARRLVLGQKQSDIAADLKRSPSSICNTIRHPAFRKILDAARQRRNDTIYDCEEHFQAHLRNACTTITDILDDDECPQGVRLGAAREVLRQSGYGPKTAAAPGQVNIENLTFDQTIQNLGSQIMAEGCQDIIDAEILHDARSLLPGRTDGDSARYDSPSDDMEEP